MPENRFISIIVRVHKTFSYFFFRQSKMKKIKQNMIDLIMLQCRKRKKNKNKRIMQRIQN